LDDDDDDDNNNNNMNLEEIGWEDVDWSGIAQWYNTGLRTG
jgi:hypothetical protein